MMKVLARPTNNAEQFVGKEENLTDTRLDLLNVS